MIRENLPIMPQLDNVSQQTCAIYNSVGLVSTLVPCLYGCLVVIRGDGQQYGQVGLRALGLLTVLRNCKRYYPRGMKTALSGSVREDGQVKTDDARPGDWPIIAVPLLHMRQQRTLGRHIWPGLPPG